MFTKRVLVAANISLVLVAFFLTLSLFDVELPSFGQTVSIFDKAPPLCVAQWKESFAEIEDLNRCCLEARKQLFCEREEFIFDSAELNWRCFTAESTLQYHFNNKGYQYCTQQDIWR